MANDTEVKVHVKIDPKKIFKKIDKKRLEKLGKGVIDLVKDNTSKGISSVAGGSRRFEAYKDPTKYPGKNNPNGKKARPVNLKLKGDMLNSIKAQVRVTDGERTIEFYFDDVNQLIKYQANHRGENGIPSRKAFPIDQGEDFSKNVSKFIDDELHKIIGAAIIDES